MNIDKFYKEVVCNRLRGVPLESNERTGMNMRALPGITFETDLEKEGFPLLSLRKLPFSFIAEQMWFIAGQDNIKWLTKHTKIWDSFAEESGIVSSAYGNRWRYAFGVDQLQTVIDKLRADPSTRHGVVMSWAPQDDLVIKQKNVPCPVMFTLMIISGRLHLHLVVRSNDMVLGFPTDVAGFAFLQHVLAQELGVRPGKYTHSISNCHIYEMHDRIVDEMALRDPSDLTVFFDPPHNSYKRAFELDDNLINASKEAFRGYAPSSAIKNIPIAL